MTLFNDFRDELPPLRTKKPVKVKQPGLLKTDTSYIRYAAAHRLWHERDFPAVIKDGHYTGVIKDMPDVNTSNGLQRFIVNYVDWIGGLGNRINVMGRTIGKEYNTTESGMVYDSRKQIGSSTKTGTADTDLQIPHAKHYFGIHVYAEIKIGKDIQGTAQYRFMNKANAAAGIYVIIRNVDQWFDFYDKLIKLADTV
jgi:hypothetical protein